MHQQIEDYLADIANSLQPLPIARRNEELREMRQHLQNAVIVNRKPGQSEIEAIENAIEQFGSPVELAHQITLAWRRGKSLYKRRFWSAIAWVCVLWFFLPHLVTPIISLYFQHTLQVPHDSVRVVALTAVSSWVFIVPLLVGVICGVFFPKEAIMGMVWGTLSWSCLLVVIFITTAAERHMLINVSAYILTLFIRGIVAILATWAVSQGRRGKIKGTSRPRPARC